MDYVKAFRTSSIKNDSQKNSHAGNMNGWDLEHENLNLEGLALPGFPPNILMTVGPNLSTSGKGTSCVAIILMIVVCIVET